MANAGNKAIIEEAIKTDAGFKLFVATELVDQTQHLKQINGSLINHDNRIGIIERWKSRLGGIWIATTIIGVVIIAVATLIIRSLCVGGWSA